MKTHATLPLSVAFALCLSAVACPGIACAATVNFDVEPTAVQNAAIRRALAADIKDFYHPEDDRWQVAQADLDDDGRPDLLVQYADSNFCGSLGCVGAIVMAPTDVYANKAIGGLPHFAGVLAANAGTPPGQHNLHLPY